MQLFAAALIPTPGQQNAQITQINVTINIQWLILTFLATLGICGLEIEKMNYILQILPLSGAMALNTLKLSNNLL